MSLATRQKQILDFVNSTEYKALDAFYSQSSLFNALGVSRHENTHSNFIAWLLTPRPEKNDHDLGDMPLRKLLETLALVCGSLSHSLGKLPPDVSNAIISGGYALSDIAVEREKHIGVGRLDIYVEGVIAFDGESYPLRLAIENKIKSSEHDGQTGRYQKELRRSVSRPGIYLGVYLTPLANREYEALNAPQCDAQGFIQLNYQYFADYVVVPCRDQATEGIKRYLDEYLLALGLPELRQDKGDIIMAISKEERDLLARFWDKHKELLIAAMLSMADSDALDDAEHEIVKNASVTLKNAVQRDMTRYTWDFQGVGGYNLPKGRLVLEVVAHYAAERSPQATFTELKDAFPDELQGSSYGVFASLDSAGSENFKGRQRYFTNNAIELADGAVAVCSQWTLEKVNSFISHAENLGYTVQAE